MGNSVVFTSEALGYRSWKGEEKEKIIESIQFSQATSVLLENVSYPC